jgi:hypothetical protein
MLLVTIASAVRAAYSQIRDPISDAHIVIMIVLLFGILATARRSVTVA